MPKGAGQHARKTDQAVTWESVWYDMPHAVEELKKAVRDTWEAVTRAERDGTKIGLLIPENLCASIMLLERVAGQVGELQEDYPVWLAAIESAKAAMERGGAAPPVAARHAHRKPSHLKRVQGLVPAGAAAFAGRMAGFAQQGTAAGTTVATAGAMGAMIAIVPGVLSPAAAPPAVVRITQAAAPAMAPVTGPAVAPTASPSGTGAATPPAPSPSPTTSSLAGCAPAVTPSPTPTATATGGSTGSSSLSVSAPPVTVTVPLPVPIPPVTVTVPPLPVPLPTVTVPAIVNNVLDKAAAVSGDVPGHHYTGRHRRDGLLAHAGW